MTIETNITKMFGIKYPIVAAPMGPFYTTKLTIAVSEAGGLGVLSHSNLANTNPVKEFKKCMLDVVEHTSKPFGFNIRTGRMQIDAEDLCRNVPKIIMSDPRIKEQCVYALTSAGSSKMLPSSKSFKELKASGSQIKHFHVAPALWLAEKCIKGGCDGVVVTGTEGGGHQSYEKIGSLVLLQQLAKEFPDIPRIASGGFATGEGLAAALALGAGAVAFGSRFIASKESEFHDNYKNIIPPAKAEDTELVTGFLGPIRLWKNEYSMHHGLIANKEEKMAKEDNMDFEALLKDQVHYLETYQGDIVHGAVVLGQSIGLIDEIEPVSVIIERIMKEAEAAIRKLGSTLK